MIHAAAAIEPTALIEPTAIVDPAAPISLAALRGVVLVTGTDTDIGKTVSTAVLASALLASGVDVGVCKPAQTGLEPGAIGDASVVARLAGLPTERVHELVRLPEPLAPTTAASRAGVGIPDVSELARQIVERAAGVDTLLVEGSGGVRVWLDAERHDLLDLADALAAEGATPTFVVVVRAGLGTLNHTQLTCDAVRAAGHNLAGIVIGSWPAAPDLAERCNRDDLPIAAGASVLAVIPAGIGGSPRSVRRTAEEACR